METLVLPIEDPSHTADARRKARHLAARIGLDDNAAERVAIILTEAATNLLKHAKRGVLCVRSLEIEDRAEIEIMALDNGPGIADFQRCLRDGFSTAGSTGTGLGAISRLSSFSDMYSQPGAGTAILVRVTSENSNGQSSNTLGVVQVAKHGQDVCGDGWGMQSNPPIRSLLLADGLGHGPDAAKAARAAVNVLNAYPEAAPKELLELIHSALRSTRGAAVAVAQMDHERRIVSFAGLGNICGQVCVPGEPARHMVSTNGTAGVEARAVREFTYPWPEGALVILHSDGINTHWQLKDYPGLISRDPGLIAGVLYRDHSRGMDDATILVAK